ncbi:hypothetical protein ACTXPD_04590 [Vreelandella alkaliphila]|uniref:hypothetical protein n=1 Tax=Vreelandella alkaliphila TaxID=272774 RepID=UPI003FD7523C
MKISNVISPEQQEETARSTRIFYRNIADKLKTTNDELTDWEMWWVNGALKQFTEEYCEAINLDDLTPRERLLVGSIILDFTEKIKAPKKHGKPKTKGQTSSNLAIEAALLVLHQSLLKSHAIERLSEKYEINERDLRRQLKEKDETGQTYYDQAIEWIGSFELSKGEKSK